MFIAPPHDTVAFPADDVQRPTIFYTQSNTVIMNSTGHGQLFEIFDGLLSILLFVMNIYYRELNICSLYK